MHKVSLKASAKRIGKGETVTLTWAANGSAECLLVPVRVDCAVSEQGSLDVTPDVTTEYRLICQKGNEVNEDRVTVRVDQNESVSESQDDAANAQVFSEDDRSDNLESDQKLISWKDDTDEFVSNRPELHRVIDYKDFVPKALQELDGPDLFRNPYYVKSSQLLHEVNIWIAQGQFEVIRVESIILPHTVSQAPEGASAKADSCPWRQFFRVWYCPHKKMKLPTPS